MPQLKFATRGARPRARRGLAARAAERAAHRAERARDRAADGHAGDDDRGEDELEDQRRRAGAGGGGGRRRRGRRGSGRRLWWRRRHGAGHDLFPGAGDADRHSAAALLVESLARPWRQRDGGSRTRPRPEPSTARGSPLPRQTNRCAYQAVAGAGALPARRDERGDEDLDAAIISEVGGSGSVISVQRSEGDSAIDLRRRRAGRARHRAERRLEVARLPRDLARPQRLGLLRPRLRAGEPAGGHDRAPAPARRRGAPRARSESGVAGDGGRGRPLVALRQLGSEPERPGAGLAASAPRPRSRPASMTSSAAARPRRRALRRPRRRVRDLGRVGSMLVGGGLGVSATSLGGGLLDDLVGGGSTSAAGSSTTSSRSARRPRRPALGDLARSARGRLVGVGAASSTTRLGAAAAGARRGTAGSSGRATGPARAAAAVGRRRRGAASSTGFGSGTTGSGGGGAGRAGSDGVGAGAGRSLATAVRRAARRRRCTWPPDRPDREGEHDPAQQRGHGHPVGRGRIRHDGALGRGVGVLRQPLLLRQGRGRDRHRVDTGGHHRQHHHRRRQIPPIRSQETDGRPYRPGPA